MEIIDISLPIYNNMWAYRPEWSNHVTTSCSTENGDSSTVYNLNLFSHTGTYIETSQHKLKNNKLLNELPLVRFFVECIVVVVNEREDGRIRLEDIQEELKSKMLSIEQGSCLIISTGYGQKENLETYISGSPYFEPSLTDFIIDKKLKLLGVDTPVIENLSDRYFPVESMFRANEDLLLLAPLKIDISIIKSGKFLLSCFPLPVTKVSGIQCRAVLIKM